MWSCWRWNILFVRFADNDDALEEWAWRVQNMLTSSEAGVAVAISNVHHDFTHAGNAYLEASTAYDNRFVMGNAHVLCFHDVSAAAKDIVPFTRSYLDGFRKALRAGDARALNFSAVRLSLDFKELSGMTPSEYLLLLRMEKAKEMLGGTRMPIKDIGLAVGYYDASGFIRRFRQHMAMTPAQYRQMIGQKEDTAMSVSE